MKYLLFFFLLLFPSGALAQLTVVQGGTGTSSVPTNYVLMGNTALHLTANATSSLGLESLLTFSSGLTRTGNAITCNTASASIFGCLLPSDWSLLHTATTTFSAPLVYTSSTNAVTCTNASNGVTGCMSATDWGLLHTATTTFSAPLSYSASTNAVTCPTCQTSAAAWPFTTGLSTYGTTTQATTTPFWFQGGLFASSTASIPTFGVTQSGTGASATFQGGNVGIGTGNPGYKLEVDGGSDNSANGPLYVKLASGLAASAGAALSLDATVSPGGKTWSFLSTPVGASPGAGAFAVYNSTDGRYEWITFGNGHTVFARDFFTDIGQLAVVPNATNVIGFVAKGASGQTADILQVKNNANSVLFNVTAGSNVGIGTTTPWGAFSVVSNNNPPFVLATTSGQIIEEIDNKGHIITGSTAQPTCGTGCVTVVGDDRTMRITTDVGVSSATVNFANTYTKTPVCISNEESAGVVVSDASSTPTTVVLDFSASLSSKSIAIICQISSNFTY